MADSKLLITLLNWFGIPVTVLGILANLESWKSDILFFLAFIFMIVRIIYFAVDKEQNRRRKNIELERERYELDEEKSKD